MTVLPQPKAPGMAVVPPWTHLSQNTHVNKSTGRFLYSVVSSPQDRSKRFTSLTDLLTQTPSRLLWEASSHMLQLMRDGCSYTYPPLSIARYSFIQLSELEQCRVKKLAQGFNTAARIRTQVLVVESEVLTLSHCALMYTCSLTLATPTWGDRTKDGNKVTGKVIKIKSQEIMSQENIIQTLLFTGNEHN